MNKERSLFAQALHDLLHSVDGMDARAWALWLNPWYAKVGPDGKLTGTRIMPIGSGGLLLDDPVNQMEVDAYWANIRANYVPCHEIGEGVTITEIQGWMNDEGVPGMGKLNELLSYFFERDLPLKAKAAFDRFDEILRRPPKEVTPFADRFGELTVRTTCIAAHLFFERYGIVGAMHRLPLPRWSASYEDLIQHFSQR